jgi:hypothetical protein
MLRPDCASPSRVAECPAFSLPTYFDSIETIHRILIFKPAKSILLRV